MSNQPLPYRSAPVLTNSTSISSWRPLLKGKASANAIVHIYEGSGTLLFGTPKANANGDWELQLTYDLMFDSSNTTTLFMAEYDAYGNRVSPQIDFTLVLSYSSAPEPLPVYGRAPYIATPPHHSTVQTPRPIFTGQSAPNARIAVLNEMLTDYYGDCWANAQGDWVFTPNKDLPAGWITLNFAQYGNAEKLSPDTPHTLYMIAASPAPPLDRQPVLTSPTSVNSLRPILTGTAAANARIEVYHAGGIPHYGTAYARADGSWEFTQWNTELVPNASSHVPIALAEYNWAGERLSNWVEATLTISRDNQAAGQLFSGTQDAIEELMRIGCLYTLSDQQPTGFYVRPTDTLEVELTLISNFNNAQPALFIGSPDADPGNADIHPTAIPLNQGINSLSNHQGGVIYFQMSGENNTAQIKFISGMQKVPTFEQGKHTTTEYRNMLAHHPKSPFAEYISRRVIITLPREAAIKHQHEDINELLDTYERIISLQERFIGLDTSSAQHSPSRPPLKNHLSISNSTVLLSAHAIHNHTAYSIVMADEMLTPAKILTYYYVWHETAHTYQMVGYIFPRAHEVFTNTAALYIQRNLVTPVPYQIYQILSSSTFEGALAKLNSPNFNYSQLNHFEQLVCFDQLRIAFGEDFWPRTNKITRERWRSDGYAPQESQALDNLIVFTSLAANSDLRPFFAKWGLPASPQGDQAINALYLQPPYMDLTTLRDPAPMY